MPVCSPSRTPRALLAIAIGVAVLAAGCGKKDKDGVATQAAARVNKSEITVHQINFLLEQQAGLKPEQVDAASKVALERLIDQELALQKAEELKLDRDPRTVQLLEAARRQVISKAYVDRISASVEKPTPEAVTQYYADKPALFKERRIFKLQEIGIEAKPDQLDTLRTKLQKAASVDDFVAQLRDGGYRFAGNQAVRSAEQLPLGLLDQVAKMQDGQALLVPSALGAQVIVLAGSKLEPVAFDKAKPAIEQFLLNEAKRKAVEADVKSMRTAAKIDYKGKFVKLADGAASDAATAAPTDVPAVAAPTPAPAGEPAASVSGAGLTQDAIAKGLKLK